MKNLGSNIYDTAKSYYKQNKAHVHGLLGDLIGQGVDFLSPGSKIPVSKAVTAGLNWLSPQ